MYLKSIHIENWRATKQLDVSFEPGLNVIYGPNESGKSSLREALRSAFVYPSRPRGRSDVSAAKPWGTKEKPVVQVCFFHKNSEWVVRKVFFTDESELQKDGRVLAQGTSVQNELTTILATEGLSALWSIQGDPEAPGVPGDLRGSFPAAETITPGSHWLIKKIDDSYEVFWTPGKQRAREPLSSVRDTTHNAERRVEQLEDELDKANELSRQTDAQDDELPRLRLQDREAKAIFEQEAEKVRNTIAELQQKLEKAAEWQKRWDSSLSRVKQEHLKQLDHANRVAELKKELGEQPSRDQVEILRQKELYLNWLVQNKLKTELEALGETDLALKRLRDLETQRDHLQALLDLTGESANTDGSTDSEATEKLEKQVAKLEADLESLAQDLERWDEAGRQKERLETELSPLRSLEEDWSEASDALRGAWSELTTYQERVQTLKDAVGPEPDRSEIEALQKRLSYLQAALCQRLRKEADGLPALSVSTLSKMDELRRKAESAKGKPGANSAPSPSNVSDNKHKVWALAGSVSFISFLLATIQDMRTSDSFALAIIIFAVTAVVAHLFFGKPPTATASNAEDSKESTEKAEKELAAILSQNKCESVEQAREAAERKKTLKAQLEALPAGNPDALSADDADRIRIDGLKEKEIRAELKATQAKLEEAENDWKKRQAAHAEARNAYETLLKDSPHSRVTAYMQQIAKLAKHDLLSGLAPPKECTQDWIEQLDQEIALQIIKAETSRLSESLEALDHPGLEKIDQAKSQQDSLKTDLKATRETLQAHLAKAQTAKGASEARLAQIQQLLDRTPYFQENLSSKEEMSLTTLPALKDKAEQLKTSVNESLETLLRETNVESREQLEAKDDLRRSLLPLLADDVSPPENLSETKSKVDSTGELEAMNRLQLSQRLAGLDKEREDAESAWTEAGKAYSEQRERLEALLKEDPSGTLASVYQQLQELAEEPEAPKLKLPDEFDPGVLDQLDTPDEAQRLLQSERQEEINKLQILLQSPEQAPEGHPLREAQDKKTVAAQELEQHSGQLNQSVGTMSAHEELYAKLSEAREELRDAQRQQRKVEMEANGLVILREALTETQQMLEDKLVAPLRERISQRLNELTQGAYKDIRIDTEFTPQDLFTADQETAPISELSFGTREQVAFLSRLCLADLLSESERQVVVFDDSLVHTDDARMKVACKLLEEAAQASQVIVLTCHPERFESLLEKANKIALGEALKTSSAT